MYGEGQRILYTQGGQSNEYITVQLIEMLTDELLNFRL